MNKKTLTWLTLILISCLFIIGCSKEKTIKVGLLFPMKGGLEGAGKNRVIAAKIAQKEINDAGGILGSRLEFILEDTESNPEIAKKKAKLLVDQGIKIIIGAFASSATIQASTETIPQEVVLISPSSTSPNISNLVDNDFVFRICASDLYQGDIAAEYIYETLRKKKVAVLYIDNDYGRGLMRVFTTKFSELGGNILGEGVAYPDSFSYIDINKVDFTPYLTRINQLKPEIVFLVGYAEAGIAPKQQEELGYNFQWFGSEGCTHPGFIKNPGATVEGMRGTAPYHEQGIYYDKYNRRFKADHPQHIESTGYAPTGYDAIILTALAITSAGTATNGKLIRDALREISSGGDRINVGEYAKAVDKIKKEIDIDFYGASGPIDFDANGDVQCPYEIWEINGANYIHIENLPVKGLDKDVN